MNLKSQKEFFVQELKNFFILKSSVRSWHIPVLAGLSVGIPLMVGLYFDQSKAALTASLAGLVILYMPITNSIFKRMLVMFVCSFGMMLSYSVGLVFSFHPIAAILAFGALTIVVHYVARTFNMKPPGSFFFIMIAAVAFMMPNDLTLAPQKIGIFTLGTMGAFLLALIYSLLIKHDLEENTSQLSIVIDRNPYHNGIESALVGLFMAISLAVSYIFELNNGYWIPISALAVLQGANSYIVGKRAIHRIIGTSVGLMLCFFILTNFNSNVGIAISIIVLQVIIELLIARHYALAVVFITPISILLAEAGSITHVDPLQLIESRFLDILIGSAIGVVGGFFIYSQKVRVYTSLSVRKMRRR
ncbi:MAG: FUSC family protein [Flavobacterium sp.]